MKTHRIFVSYARDEHAMLAVRLREDLRVREHEAWFNCCEAKGVCHA